MPASGHSRANENRRIRQEALREMLSKKCTVEQVLEIADKLANLDEELDSLAVQRLKASADIKKSLLAKYIPDLKQMDIDMTADITAREVTRAELEAKLLAQGFDITTL